MVDLGKYVPQISKLHPESSIYTACSVSLKDVWNCSKAAKLTCAGKSLTEFSRRLFPLSRLKVEQFGELLFTLNSKTRNGGY